MHGTLLENSLFERLSDAVAVGTSDVNGDPIVLGSGQGVCFVAVLGAQTDSDPTLKAQGSDDSGVGDAWSDLKDTAVVGADTDDNKLLILDVKRPQKKTIRPVLERGGATGGVVDAILAIVYDLREVPATQGSDVANSESHLAPAEGTA